MTFFRQRLRFERYDEIHISPHMDDAVYSCGGRIAQLTRSGKKVLVVTLFGPGTARAEEGAGGRHHQRFRNYEARWEEECAAMERLGADYAWVNAPELLFRSQSFKQRARWFLPFLPVVLDGLHAQLCTLLLQLGQQRLAPGGTVLFPLGIGFHPDHRIAFEVGRALHGLGEFRVEFYEDAVYAHHESFVSLRLQYLGAPTRIRWLQTAREINDFVHQDAGALRWLHLPGTSLFVLLVVAVRAVSKIEDRLPGEGLPRRISRSIADAIDDKVAAMHLYPSQTEYIFGKAETLYDQLRRDGDYQEHTWIFPRVPVTRRRLPHGLFSPSAAATSSSRLELG